ncbi:MAG: dihydrolipoyl dehydrogenase family protein [Bosea sp. (in: a-proteobacteria)]
MTTVLTPDICVIGAGSGGLSVAAAAAIFGVPVVLVERDQMGGDCLNVGCVPSKALLAAAHHAQSMRDAGPFGITAVEPQINFARVQAHVASVIEAIAPNDSVERFTALGVQFIKGEARFSDPRTMMVGDQAIRARRFVIATGSRPAVPPIPGLDAVPYFTNETIFAQTRRPERLLVLGGGPIGIEMAQAMRRLGSDVTLVEGQRILSREDEEVAAYIRRALLSEGVVIREQAKVLRAEKVGARIRLVIEGANGEENNEGSHLLVATGRKPNIEALELAIGSVRFDAKGITVDKGLKTSNSRVYAIGDCATGATGGLQFTHVANYHAGLVIRNALFRMPVKVNNSTLARVTYSDPEVASVGLSEAEAAAQKIKIGLLRWPYGENDRAQAERRTEGFVKLVTSPKGKILGATIVGAHAGEMIVTWSLAIQKGMSVSDIAGLVFPYPTLSEAGKRAAMSHYSPLASKPGIRRLIGFLRKFG